jgi:hypothetical protein
MTKLEKGSCSENYKILFKTHKHFFGSYILQTFLIGYNDGYK